MRVKQTPIPDLKLVELEVHGDQRGFFVERYNADKFKALGLPTDFVQDNHSRSAPHTIRGLHYQQNPAQGKLVGALKGRIYDVAVDIRPDSPTYSQHFGVELSDENGLLLWVPPGFAHGFCVLDHGPADVLYKVTGRYNPEGEGGIRFDDPVLAIKWPTHSPLLSERDKKQPDWAEYCANPVQWS